MSQTLYLRRPAAHQAGAQQVLRPRAWAILGALVGGLLAMLMFAPARWLAQAVYRASGEQVLLAEPRGTVWRGSARLTLTGGAGSRDVTALPERVRWTLGPSLKGLHVSLLAECCTPQALQLWLRPGWDGWHAQMADARVQWPASLLAGLGTPWNTLQPTGVLTLQSQGLGADWNEGRWRLGGGAVLEARDVSSPLSTLKPLGSYRLRLQGGPSATVVLDTLEGGLQLKGNGQWIGSRLHFSGEASAAPDREAALANLLNIVGIRNGSRSIITIG